MRRLFALALLVLMLSPLEALAGHIFVAKLHYDTTSEDLLEAFQSFGEVTSAKIDRDEFGVSRGMAVVSMPNTVQTAAAIKGMAGKTLGGKSIEVRKATDEEVRRIEAQPAPREPAPAEPAPTKPSPAEPAPGHPPMP